jgi:NTE family protein
MKKLIIISLFFISIVCYANESIERPKIGLVLSGGGARGIAHIGVLSVLEELGIEPDYITGTSMGAIIGGLYAVGYDSKQLGNILEKQNWRELLLDEMLLSDVSFEEKDYVERYIGELPIENYRIKLPSGIVAGQRISKFLSDITISTNQVEDFDDLRIPFRCIATDLETGEPVVLKNGTLAEAMRISMSIPSAFTPVMYEDKILIDGGIARNLPVQDAIEMGADIVIAVDVSSELYSKEKLNSLVRVMEQSVNFRGIERSREQQKLADILIKPEVNDVSILEFEDISNLLELGKEAAYSKYDELKKIAEEQRKYEKEDRGIPILKVDKVKINKINVKGLRTVSKNLVIGKLRIEEHSVSDFEKISKAIDRLWGSMYFERVTYRLIPSEKGADLEITVIEKSNNVFNFSFNYNSETKAQILLNQTSRNLLLEGSRLSVDAILSESPSFDASYFLHLGWKPGFGLGVSAHGERYKIRFASENKLEEFVYDQASANFVLQTIFLNSAAFGLGIEYDLNSIKSEYNNQFDELRYQVYRSYAFVNVNSLDRKYFPKKGVNLSAKFEFIIPLDDNKDNSTKEAFNRFIYKSDKYLPLNDRSSINFGMTIGSLSADAQTVVPLYLFSLGGNINVAQNIIPYYGYKPNSILDSNFGMSKISIIYNVWNEIYFSQGVSILTHSDHLLGILDTQDIVLGFCSKLGIRAPFGNITYSISRNSDTKEFIHFINVGHEF